MTDDIIVKIKMDRSSMDQEEKQESFTNSKEIKEDKKEENLFSIGHGIYCIIM